MSKNFEEAYKEELQLNIPDLWDRIESNLPEKNMQDVKAENESKQVIPVKIVQPKEQNTIVKRDIRYTKKKRPYAWIKWASLAVAGVLVVLLIPTVLSLGILGFGSEETATADNAAEQIIADTNTISDEYIEVEMETTATESGEYADVSLVGDTVGSQAESDVVQETVPKENAESIGQEDNSGMSAALGNSPSEESVLQDMYDTGFYEKVAGGLYVEVLGFQDMGDYYQATLNFSDLSKMVADELFEGSAYYSEGSLYVIIYSDRGDLPVGGEKYTVDIYNITPPWQSLILPYVAELDNND